MPTIDEVESRRNAVLEEMRGIRAMSRGTINEQFLNVRHKGIKEPVARGPYYVLSRYDPNMRKTQSRRLTSSAALEQARSDVAAYQHFSSLCREYELLTERLAELERGVAEHEAKKKLRRSPSNKKAR